MSDLSDERVRRILQGWVDADPAEDLIALAREVRALRERVAEANADRTLYEKEARALAREVLALREKLTGAAALASALADGWERETEATNDPVWAVRQIDYHRARLAEIMREGS